MKNELATLRSATDQLVSVYKSCNSRSKDLSDQVFKYERVLQQTTAQLETCNRQTQLKNYLDTSQATDVKDRLSQLLDFYHGFISSLKTDTLQLSLEQLTGYVNKTVTAYKQLLKVSKEEKKACAECREVLGDTMRQYAGDFANSGNTKGQSNVKGNEINAMLTSIESLWNYFNENFLHDMCRLFVVADSKTNPKLLIG